MMPFPENFDQNEWFVLISLIMTVSIAYALPKKVPLSITVMMMIFSVTTARLADHLLSSPKVDLYNIMDTGNYELFDLILYFLYAPFGYIFVNLYEKLKINGYWTVVYIIVWSSFGTLFEWVSVQFNVFIYNKWQLPYSFTIYVFTQALTLLVYVNLRYLYKEHTQNNNPRDRLNTNSQ